MNVPAGSGFDFIKLLVELNVSNIAFRGADDIIVCLLLNCALHPSDYQYLSRTGAMRFQVIISFCEVRFHTMDD